MSVKRELTVYVYSCWSFWSSIIFPQFPISTSAWKIHLLTHFVKCVISKSLQLLSTWYFRFPLGILLVWPSVFQTSQNRSMKNSAAEYTSCDILLMPLPLLYWGRNHSMKSQSNRLPLKACAIMWISCGVAQTGTFLHKTGKVCLLVSNTFNNW